MLEQTANHRVCPSPDIGAYIDGELSSKREFELDVHFASCPVCLDELNDQKNFLTSLEYSLQGESDIELPPDFARVIVANAESTVSGLRRPRERFNALFICSGLLLFALFALGADAARVFGGIFNFFEQAAAVGSFFGHLVYSFFLGISIVVRSLALQAGGGEAGSLILAFAAGAAVLAYFSQKLTRVHRA